MPFIRRRGADVSLARLDQNFKILPHKRIFLGGEAGLKLFHGRAGVTTKLFRTIWSWNRDAVVHALNA